MSRAIGSFLALLLVVLLLVGTTGCVAGSERYEAKKATFWGGLFHGIISPVTLFITLFTGAIDMYESNNVGWGYDCGFFLGLLIILGGGCGSRSKIRLATCAKKRARDWEVLGTEIEQEILDGIRACKGSEGGPAAEADEESWEEIGRKIEEKVKRKLKEWADKD